MGARGFRDHSQALSNRHNTEKKGGISLVTRHSFGKNRERRPRYEARGVFKYTSTLKKYTPHLFWYYQLKGYLGYRPVVQVTRYEVAYYIHNIASKSWKHYVVPHYQNCSYSNKSRQWTSLESI